MYVCTVGVCAHAYTTVVSQTYIGTNFATDSAHRIGYEAWPTLFFQASAIMLPEGRLHPSAGWRAATSKQQSQEWPPVIRAVGEGAEMMQPLVRPVVCKADEQKGGGTALLHCTALQRNATTALDGIARAAAATATATATAVGVATMPSLPAPLDGRRRRRQRTWHRGHRHRRKLTGNPAYVYNDSPWRRAESACSALQVQQKPWKGSDTGLFLRRRHVSWLKATLNILGQGQGRWRITTPAAQPHWLVSPSAPD